LQTVYDDVVQDNLSEALLSGVEDKPLIKVEVSFDGKDTGFTKLSETVTIGDIKKLGEVTTIKFTVNAVLLPPPPPPQPPSLGRRFVLLMPNVLPSRMWGSQAHLLLIHHIQLMTMMLVGDVVRRCQVLL
jgi:hypothetical protein